MSIADKLTQIAENEQKVYESGKRVGNSEGYQNGYTLGHNHGEQYGKELGKQEAYDAFWDNYQDNGKRTLYNYAFNHWTDDAFKPKYDIVPTTMTGGFQYSKITDLKGLLERQGVKLDLSSATSLNQLFLYSSCTTCPVVDVSKVYAAPVTFFTHAHDLKTIEKIILPTGKVMTFTNPFHSCENLENIVFEGDIMANGVSFQWSPKLSKDSITSVVNALSPDTSGLTVTFSKTAVEAFDSEITAIPFGLTTAQEGANVTGVDNGDGTATFNGTIEYDTYFSYGNATDVFSAGSYVFNAQKVSGGDIYVSVCDLDGNTLDFFGDGDMVGGTRSFTSDVDFVVKTQLYMYGAANFNNVVIAYPTIRPDFETLKATKPNWTITLV